jgi:uncharacterized Zn finger protein (UPF0148 family)
MAQKLSVSSKNVIRQTRRLAWDSDCLECGAFLARSKGPYTGTVACEECGAINYFENSNKPLRAVAVRKAS